MKIKRKVKEEFRAVLKNGDKIIVTDPTGATVNVTVTVYEDMATFEFATPQLRLTNNDTGFGGSYVVS